MRAVAATVSLFVQRRSNMHSPSAERKTFRIGMSEVVDVVMIEADVGEALMR